jgi:hypothetical protein
MAKPVLKARITVKKPPALTSTGNASFMDADDKRNFADAALGVMGVVQAGQVLDVERTHNPATTKNGRTYDESFNIVSWKTATDAGVPVPNQPVLPFTRPRTDPKDQRQMFVTANMKEWVAAYAQLLSITTTGEMKPMDAGVVEQAARVFGVVYDRLFGPMTQSNKPPVDEDMNDEIGF